MCNSIASLEKVMHFLLALCALCVYMCTSIDKIRLTAVLSYLHSALPHRHTLYSQLQSISRVIAIKYYKRFSVWSGSERNVDILRLSPPTELNLAMAAISTDTVEATNKNKK